MTSANKGLLATVLSIAWVASLGNPGSARADHDIQTPFTGTRPFQLELHGGLAWYGFGFAGGARFGIPLMQNGFISSLDNAVYVNFGGDFYFVDDYGCYARNPGEPCHGHAYRFAVGFPVALHWEFYFSDMWSAFAELGLQVFLPPSLFYRGYIEYNEHVGQWVIAAVGGSLHLGEVLSLTARIGNPYVSFGITLNLG